jgi:8-oxo-dGTP pyrophosphatase MutT (NUDIX family)
MANQEYSIYKIGGILIKDRKLLVCRSKGKEAFIAPGGKIEGNEKPFDALRRELMEEIGVTVEEGNIGIFGTFYAPAAYDPKNILRMDVLLVNLWQGEPKAGSEVEEIAWVNTDMAKNMKMGSIFEHEVLPRLKKKNLID